MKSALIAAGLMILVAYFIYKGVEQNTEEVDRILAQEQYCTWPHLETCRPGLFFVSGPDYPTLVELADNAFNNPLLHQLWIPPSACERNRFKVTKRRNGRAGWTFCLLDGFSRTFELSDPELDEIARWERDASRQYR